MRGAEEESRRDGLKIFIDDNESLNKIKRTAPKMGVITAVALNVAKHVAINYAEKHAPEHADEIRNAWKHFDLEVMKSVRTLLPEGNSMEL